MNSSRTAAILLVLGALSIGACSTRRVVLVNDAGHRTECTAEGYGWGALGTDGMIQDCVQRMEAKGYRRAE